MGLGLSLDPVHKMYHHVYRNPLKPETFLAPRTLDKEYSICM